MLKTTLFLTRCTGKGSLCPAACRELEGVLRPHPVTAACAGRSWQGRGTSLLLPGSLLWARWAPGVKGTGLLQLTGVAEPWEAVPPAHCSLSGGLRLPRILSSTHIPNLYPQCQKKKKKRGGIKITSYHNCNCYPREMARHHFEATYGLG